MNKRTNSWRARAVAVALGVSVSLVGCLNDDENDGPASVLGAGDMLPEFTIEVSYPSEDWHSAEVTTADLEGEPSLLVFFNTSCSDCQQELPVIQQLYDQMRLSVFTSSDDSRTEDGRAASQSEEQDAPTIIAISRAESMSSVKAYWLANGLTIPVSAQDDATLFHKFANHTIPHIFLSNSSLIIQQVWTDDPMPTLSELSVSFGEFR